MERNIFRSCAECGQKDIIEKMRYDINGYVYLCPECENETRVSRGSLEWKRRHAETRNKQAAELRFERRFKLGKGVIVTSTPELSGWRIKQYLGFHGVEYNLVIHSMPDIPFDASYYPDTVAQDPGRRFLEAKEMAMSALRFVAFEKGANAIVGIRMDFIEIGGVIALIINGTLVVAEPIPASG